MTFKSSWIGEGDRYNYGQLCVPTYPCKKEAPAKINFYSKDEEIPYFLALLMGLQHCFAMVGGLITPPLVIFRFSVCSPIDPCPELETYAVSAALIASGICSILNITKFKIPFADKIFGRDMYYGSGILSVMGTSFTFLPIFEISINQMKNSGWDGDAAYGAMLGTSMVCCLFELAFSLLPITYIKRLFPPQVTSITVVLLGISLCGTGMKYWGGGVVCAEMGWKTHQQVVNANVTLPPPFATCQNGETNEIYGVAPYIGLGFSVLCSLVVIELFGSVFMKNCNVIIALCMGYIIAAVTNLNGEDYVTTDNIAAARPVTFLWVETYPLSFYGPAVVPLVVAYLVTTVETVGDISATFEASQLSTEGEFYETSVQGGLTSDGFCSILSGLMTSMPNTTFSQNNGVISLTKCASRRAGYGAAFWMIMLGVFGKFAGVITAIPDCVLGGMTIFLFANVLTSGINLTHNVDLNSRRNKFIMALSLAIGVGVTVWPYAFQDRRASPYTAGFWTCADCSTTMQGVRNGVSIFLSTGYCVGTVIAMLLNGILPADAPIAYDDHDELVVHYEPGGVIEKVDKVSDEVTDKTPPTLHADKVEEEAPTDAAKQADVESA